MPRTTHIGYLIWNRYRYKIHPDLNFISFLKFKHLDKFDHKAIWLFSVSYRFQFSSINFPSPLRFHLSINFVFSQISISHHSCKKCSNLWCSNKCKMDLQVKKLKVELSATPRKNSVTGPYHHSPGRDKLLIPPVKGEA